MAGWRQGHEEMDAYTGAVRGRNLGIKGDDLCWDKASRDTITNPLPLLKIRQGFNVWIAAVWTQR